MQKLDQASYEKFLKGFNLIDCVVRDKDTFYFLALEELEDDADHTPYTVLLCGANRPTMAPWAYVKLKGMHYFKAGVAFKPKEQFVGVSRNDHVYAVGSGEKGFEDDIGGGRAATGFDSGMRGGLSKLRTIGGYLWLTGNGRTVGRRVDKNTWEWHDIIPFKSAMDDGGFNDIDGFSEQEIYAVGGHGDVWHYDGKRWTQLAFPSNMTLETVCCGGDGEVYIGAESGSLFKGRGNTWKRISKGRMTIPFKDMVWHAGRLWCTSDYGLWTVEKDKVVDANVPASVRVCAGNLSVGDGVMLLAGMYGATVHDGKDWQRIIDFNDFT